MKRIVLYILLTSTCFSLIGCKGEAKSLSAKDIEVNTILIRNDGAIQSGDVEDFDKPYYNEEELKNFIIDDVTEFNVTAGKDVVTMNSFAINDLTAKLVLTYADIDDYVNFCKVDAKLLSTAEALIDKDIPATLTSVSKEKSFTKAEALQDDNYKVLIIKEPLDVRVQGNIKYYSNAVLLNDSAVQTEEDGISIIVYKP